MNKGFWNFKEAHGKNLCLYDVDKDISFSYEELENEISKILVKEKKTCNFIL